MNLEIKNPLQADWVALTSIVQGIDQIRIDFKKNEPAVDRKDFRRAYIRNAEHHLKRLDVLRDKSVNTYYHTEFGLHFGALLDRAIAIKQAQLDLNARILKNQKPDHLADRTETLDREFNRIIRYLEQTFKGLANKVNGDPALQPDEAGSSQLQEIGDK